MNTKNTTIKGGNELDDLISKIKTINLKLWETEDKIRICEKNKNFGGEFIQLARDVYIDNDERARIKLNINKLLGSSFIEIKDYSSY